MKKMSKIDDFHPKSSRSAMKNGAISSKSWFSITIHHFHIQTGLVYVFITCCSQFMKRNVSKISKNPFCLHRQQFWTDKPCPTYLWTYWERVIFWSPSSTFLDSTLNSASIECNFSFIALLFVEISPFKLIKIMR